VQPEIQKPSAQAVQAPSTAWALAGLALSMLLSSLGTSIANVALPTLAAAFDATFQAVQWVVLAYLLGITVSIVSVGRLGDLYGRRRLFVRGLLLFVGAAAMSGLAPSLGLLILARAAQGVGAAVLMALTLAFVADVVPKERTGSAMGLLGTTSAIGTALGPSVGGVLTGHLGWHAVFLVQVPVGLLALLLALRFLPVDHTEGARRRVGFDHVGTLLLASTLAAYSLAVTLGRGDFGLVNAACLVAAAVGAGLFVVVERRVASPLVELSMFREPALRAGLTMSMLVSTVLMATLVVGPFYLSRGLGLAAGSVGMVMAIGPLVAALTGVPAGKVVDRLGTHRTTMAGLLGVAAGASILAVAPESSGIPGYVAPVVVLTASYALFQAANNTGVLKDLSPARRGVVSGMLTLSRNLGLVTGAAVMGAVFAAASGHGDIAQATADEVATGMRVTFALAAALITVAVGVGLGGRAVAARRCSPRTHRTPLTHPGTCCRGCVLGRRMAPSPTAVIPIPDDRGNIDPLVAPLEGIEKVHVVTGVRSGPLGLV
jgi:EmrB/QacA subfamily drug resistance transporter